MPLPASLAVGGAARCNTPWVRALARPYVVPLFLLRGSLAADADPAAFVVDHGSIMSSFDHDAGWWVVPEGSDGYKERDLDSPRGFRRPDEDESPICGLVGYRRG